MNLPKPTAKQRAQGEVYTIYNTTTKRAMAETTREGAKEASKLPNISYASTAFYIDNIKPKEN